MPKWVILFAIANAAWVLLVYSPDVEQAMERVA